MRSDKEQKTVDYYDKQAVQWASEHGGFKSESYWKAQMEKFHGLLPSGRILEIGSGAGKDTKALKRLGYDYVGTDASSGLIEVAQKRNPEAKFYHSGVEELDFPENSFDGFWAAAVLLHIAKENIDTALQKIKSKMRDGAIGFISLKAGEGEAEDKNTGRWFAYYQEDEFKQILERNGLQIVEVEKREEERADRPDWLVFYVKV